MGEGGKSVSTCVGTNYYPMHIISVSCINNMWFNTRFHITVRLIASGIINWISNLKIKQMYPWDCESKDVSDKTFCILCNGIKWKPNAHKIIFTHLITANLNATKTGFFPEIIGFQIFIRFSVSKTRLVEVCSLILCQNT